MVPMSDGAKIAVHRYAAKNSPAPAVLMVTPYRKEGSFDTGWLLADHGYDFLIADIRGFGGSNVPYAGFYSDREYQDGVDLIEWTAKQKFCNGKVSMIGGSYTGLEQLMIAARRPKSLLAIAPSVGPVDTFREFTYRGGIFSFGVWGTTYLRSGLSETVRRGLQEYFGEIMSVPFDNPGHHRRSPEYYLSKINVPVLANGGWYDYFLRGTFRSYLKTGGPRRLLVGPWGHVSLHASCQEEMFKWLDYWMSDKGTDPTKGNNVRLMKTGIDEWIEREQWFDFANAKFEEWRPVSAPSETRIHANFGTIKPPTNILSHFGADSGYSHWGEAWTTDGEGFSRDTDIDGPVGLEAVIDGGDSRDFEIHARISIVKPDGKCVQLTEGRLRASHRAVDIGKSYCSSSEVPILPWHPHDKADPVKPGEPARLNVELNPVCHRIFAGEKLRIGISLIRADENLVPCEARVLPATRVLLPLTTG
jgi:uncharacterized protein